MTEESHQSTRSFLSFPPWPEVRLGKTVPWIVSVVIAVYSGGGILVYSFRGGLELLLIVAVLGFMGFGFVTMFVGFILRAFDASRVLGTYFVRVGAFFGVIGPLNLMVLMSI